MSELSIKPFFLLSCHVDSLNYLFVFLIKETKKIISLIIDSDIT